MKRLLQSVFCAAVLIASASAADLALLKNGFSIRHERHEAIGNTTRLYVDASSSSFIDVATSEIVGYEPDPSPPPSVAVPTVAPDPAKSIQDHIAHASKAHGVDPDFIASVIRSESSSNPRAVSPKGARGLMQLMPATANQLGVKDSFDPGANIDAGTRYLRHLLEQYHGDAAKALAAYNAGPHRVDQYKGVPPYYETRAYVARTIHDYNNRKLASDKRAAKKAPATKSNSPRATKSSSASKSTTAPKSNPSTTATTTTPRKPA